MAVALYRARLEDVLAVLALTKEVDLVMFAPSIEIEIGMDRRRILEVTYKTAWFMTHRIREAMTEGDWRTIGKLGNDTVRIPRVSGRK